MLASSSSSSLLFAQPQSNVARSRSRSPKETCKQSIETCKQLIETTHRLTGQAEVNLAVAKELCQHYPTPLAKKSLSVCEGLTTKITDHALLLEAWCKVCEVEHEAAN